MHLTFPNIWLLIVLCILKFILFVSNDYETQKDQIIKFNDEELV